MKLLIVTYVISFHFFENAQNIWFPEIKKRFPGKPFILLGTKSDLRDEFELHTEEYRAKGMEPIATKKGNKISNEIGACAYLECSALTRFHLCEVFDEAVKFVINSQPLAQASGECCKII